MGTEAAKPEVEPVATMEAGPKDASAGTTTFVGPKFPLEEAVATPRVALPRVKVTLSPDPNPEPLTDTALPGASQTPVDSVRRG
jgi:hypothetical protein